LYLISKSSNCYKAKHRQTDRQTDRDRERERERERARMSGAEKVVCVTGASGYIASWVVKILLYRGYTVKASSQPARQHSTSGNSGNDYILNKARISTTVEMLLAVKQQT
jgi:hypothetical protein